MATKLVVSEEQHHFYLQWEEDGDPGGYLCQSKNDGLGAAPKDREEWEHWAASLAVRSAPGFDRDTRGAVWETEKEARVALRLAKEALKQDRPMPEWATSALAAGWTPPKGWKA